LLSFLVIFLFFVFGMLLTHQGETLNTNYQTLLNELPRLKQRGINRNIFIAPKGGEFTPCPPPAD